MNAARLWLLTFVGLTVAALGWKAISTSAAPAAPNLNQPAPELVGGPWLNTPGNKPITLASRKGKVTVVEYWTFACSNCQANLPSYDRLEKKFADRDVEIIGVHTPEFDFERKTENVAARVKKLGITYPILLDSQSQNWRRWNQQYWPTIYVIGKDGNIRYQWVGELQSGGRDGEAKVASVIEALLKEDTPRVSTRANAEVSPALASGKVEKVSKTNAEWKKILTPQQYYILREAGTERAYSGQYESQGKGIYRCAACNLELYSSETMFHSGTGWPSFYQPIAANHVIEKTDADGNRTEILCARCDGHLGHVFDDGPQPTGLRYCMNSPALKFDAGTTKLAPAKATTKPVAAKSAAAKSAAAKSAIKTATFAGGCFWSMEAIYEQIKGVVAVEPGYSGGTTKNPTYEQVGGGDTGYAESISIRYDSNIVSYYDLLRVLFTLRDPTTLNSQGPDVGTQYRSAIFYHDPAQQEASQKIIEEFTQKRVWPGKIVTEVKPFTKFYTAEEYHRDYFTKNPTAGYCVAAIAPKLSDLKKKFPELVKS